MASLPLSIDRVAPPRTRRGGRLGLVLVLLVLLVIAAGLSLAVGARPVPLGHVWHALGSQPPRGVDDTIVRGLRVPRTLLGIVAGLGLGVAGALMQGHTRNPLADPGLLGVSGGAGFALVIGVQVVEIGGLTGSIWFAFAGALAAALLVVTLGARSRDGLTPVSMALIGLTVSELLIALTTAIVVHGRNATLDAYRLWSVGSLTQHGGDVALGVLPFLAAGLLLAAANAPALNTLALGDDMARGLGQNVRRARLVGLAAITLLTGTAVAACGQLGFVGLAAPHLVRRFTGPDHRWLLPAAGLAGAVLLLVADVVSRVVLRPSELPVGVVLGVVGAPFFVVLVRRLRQVRV